MVSMENPALVIVEVNRDTNHVVVRMGDGRVLAEVDAPGGLVVDCGSDDLTMPLEAREVWVARRRRSFGTASSIREEPYEYAVEPIEGTPVVWRWRSNPHSARALTYAERAELHADDRRVEFLPVQQAIEEWERTRFPEHVINLDGAGSTSDDNLTRRFTPAEIAAARDAARAAQPTEGTDATD